MAVQLKKMLVSKSKYNIKCPYSMSATSITVHNTWNDASAANEVKYMIGNNNKVSFHIAVDDKEAVQGIPLDRNAWHAGDGNGTGNRRSIGIEICYSKSGGERFKKAERNAAELIAKMLKERGWGIDKVKKHQDWSGKYCPHRTLDMGWNRFLNMVREYMGGTSTTPSKPSVETDKLYRVRKTWNDASSQIGAYSSLENAKKACKSGYTVFDWNGNSVYQKKYANNDIEVDGWWGKDTTKALQKILGTTVDGIVSYQPRSNEKYLERCDNSSWQFTSDYKPGSNMVRALQRLIGVDDDGYFGKKSAIALQKFLEKNGFSVGKAGCNGYVGKDTVSALQRWINKQI